MENVKPFFDLCVNATCTDWPEVFSKLKEFGYRTIAINQYIDTDDTIETSKKKKKGNAKDNNDIIPTPITISKHNHEGIQILNRITIAFTDKNLVFKAMQSQNIKKYHLVAVIAKSNDAFQYVCESIDADIISYDPIESKIKFNRKLYGKVVERDLHFELMYYPAIQSSTLRKNTITRSHIYHQLGKLKNVIITSGAINVLSLRGPYDIVNLGLIFGLSEEQSKHAIGTACSNVINRAIGRKLGKALVFVKKIEGESDNDLMEIDSDEPIQKKLKT